MERLSARLCRRAFGFRNGAAATARETKARRRPFARAGDWRQSQFAAAPDGLQDGFRLPSLLHRLFGHRALALLAPGGNDFLHAPRYRASRRRSASSLAIALLKSTAILSRSASAPDFAAFTAWSPLAAVLSPLCRASARQGGGSRLFGRLLSAHVPTSGSQAT